MSAQIIDGKLVAKSIREKVAKSVEMRKSQGLRPPGLAVILIGEDPASAVYVNSKKRACEQAGLISKAWHWPNTATQTELLDLIRQLNEDSSIDGILVQLPLPDHMDTQAVLDLVPASLDVDVLSSSGRILFAEGKSNYIPPVTASVLEVCKRHNVVLKDINIVLVGEGTLVGKPMGIWLTMHGYLYDVITKETDMEKRAILLKNADLIISGAGVPHLVKPSDVKQGVVIIDAGTSEAQAVIQGDVDPEVQEKSSLFTPVPGGIGPMTIALLYTNVIAYYHHD